MKNLRQNSSFRGQESRPHRVLIGVIVVVALIVPSYAVPSYGIVWGQDAATFTQFPAPQDGLPIPDSLAHIYAGGAPRSADDLRQMDTYQQELVRRVTPTTVAVQVGPTQGSGVIVTPDGYVLTASHVARRPGMRARIIFYDGVQVLGTTMGMNKNVDAGLIKIDTSPDSVGKDTWPFAAVGSAADLRVGMWCLALGHAGGFQPDRIQPNVRIGRILNVQRRSIETDCKLVGGDSGGPLFDMRGRVIGINSRIGADLDKNIHVPVDTFHSTWARLVQGESWGSLANVLGRARPVIGVIRAADSDSPRIETVVPDSPAEHVGIKPGDLITRFDSRSITTFSQLSQLVQQHEPGDEVWVELERNGTEVKVKLVLGFGAPPGDK